MFWFRPIAAGSTSATYTDEEPIEIKADFVLHRHGPLPFRMLRHYASAIARRLPRSSDNLRLNTEAVRLPRTDIDRCRW